MARGPETLYPVEVHGTLHLDAPSGGTVRLEAVGGVLSLRAATLRDLRDLLPGGITRLPCRLRQAAAALAVAGLALDVRVDGQRLLRCGVDTRPNWLARLAGLPKTRIQIRTLLAAYWR